MKIYKTLPDLDRRKQLALFHTATKVNWSPVDIDYDAAGDQLKDKHRRALARALSPILMGEQAGLYSITSIVQLLGKTSEVEAQLFFTSMVMDEAKHVEVFTHYYRRLGQDPLSIRRFPPGYLFQSAIVSDDPIVWLTGSLVSEVLAKQSLEDVRKLHIDPVLDTMCNRILEDEARHLGFNHVFLADRFKGYFEKDQTDAQEIAEKLEARLEHVLDRVPAILQGLKADTDEIGMENPDDFFDRLRDDCRKRLRRSIKAGQREWKNATLAEAVEAD